MKLIFIIFIKSGLRIIFQIKYNKFFKISYFNIKMTFIYGNEDFCYTYIYVFATFLNYLLAYDHIIGFLYL